jgi:hypothetical protein
MGLKSKRVFIFSPGRLEPGGAGQRPSRQSPKLAAVFPPDKLTFIAHSFIF